MKRFLKVVLGLGIGVGLLFYSPVHSLMQAVPLNGQLQVLIESGIVLAVAWAFTQLTQLWPWFGQFFGQYQDEVATALAGAVVTLAQNYLNLIPPNWEDVGVQAQVLIVAILAAISALHLLGKAKNSLLTRFA